MADAIARDSKTTIAVRMSTKERMRTLMAEGETYDDWLRKQVRAAELALEAELDAISYREMPEGATDEWGDLVEHIEGLGSEAAAALHQDDWGC